MSEVAKFEDYLEEQKIVTKRGEQAERLSRNPDFRDLIIKGFCRDDAARLVQEAGDPILNAEQRADALNMALASGHLKRYLVMAIQMGKTAERSLPEIEENLAEARAAEGAL